MGEGRGGEDKLVKGAFWSASTVVEDDVLLPAVLCKRSGDPVVVQAELTMYEYPAEGPEIAIHGRIVLLFLVEGGW